MSKVIKLFLKLLAISGSLSALAADPYPNKPIRIIVPLAPGGVTDVAARIVGAKLSERLGQPVIVENKPGASQAIGSEFVANAPPDGYTIIMGTISAFAINASLYKNLRYSISKDFAPISLATSQPLMLVVHPSVPANTVPELIALLKANPGKYAFGSPGGSGTSGHMTTELFMMKTGTSMIHIPYKGSGPMIIDLMGGQIQVAFDNLPTALAQVKNGKLKALAITSAERSKFAPNIPTLNEYIPGMTVTAWQGLFAPVKTPAPILDQLSNEVQAVMKMPEVVSKLNDLGVTPVGNNRAEFSAFVKDEISRWGEVVRISGAKPDE